MISVHKVGTHMVHAFGTLKRNPRSGVFFLRKRVPGRLRKAVGKREIKISLRTRDPDVARIRHLEQLLRIEQTFAQFDSTRTAATHLATLGGEIGRLGLRLVRPLREVAATVEDRTASLRSQR